MLHAYYFFFFGKKRVCFIHVESLDEQSLKYMLDRCSQKGKNRVGLMWWHIPYSGQWQAWSAKWGILCSISTAQPKRCSTTWSPAMTVTRKGDSVYCGQEFHRAAGGVCFRCSDLWCSAYDGGRLGRESWSLGFHLQVGAWVSVSPCQMLPLISSQFILFMACKLDAVWLLWECISLLKLDLLFWNIGNEKWN